VVSSVLCVTPSVQQQLTIWVVVQLLFCSNSTRIDIIKFKFIFQLIIISLLCYDVDFQEFCFNDSTPETIPSTVLVTPYQPDIAFYNIHSSLMGIIELTCPLDSVQHIKSDYDQKQSKSEYWQLGSAGPFAYYKTVEVSVLGHFQYSYVAFSPSEYFYCLKLVLHDFKVRSPGCWFLLHSRYSLVEALKNGL